MEREILKGEWSQMPKTGMKWVKMGEIWEQWNDSRTSVMNIIGWWVSGCDIKLG